MAASANLTPVKCWAASLGDCDEKISREHIVSQALFTEDAVTVQGFPWCLDQPKTIGLANLVTKILCKKHNSELSEVDAVALAAFNAFRESVRINDVRTGLNSRSWAIRRFVVDGVGLERWFLKTLINLSFGGDWIIGPGTHSKGMPSPELVEIAFGIRQFQNGAGLYVAGHAGEKINSRDGVRITPKTYNQNLVAGGFVFRGYRFFLNLLCHEFRMDGESHLLYHGAKLRFKVPNKKGKLLFSHEIAFKWPKGIAEQRPRPRYTMEELLAASDYSRPLPPEEREWIDAPAVGREVI